MAKVRRIWSKLTLPLGKYSEDIMLAIILAVTLFLLGGGLYDIVERPSWFIAIQTPRGTVYRFYWPGGIMGAQTLSESLAVIIAYTGMLLGLLTVHHGIRRVYEPKYSTALIILGGVVALISLSIIWLILTSKM